MDSFTDIYYSQNVDGIILYIKVKPNSKSNAIVGIESSSDGAKKASLLIKITSAPKEGEANKELINFLSKLLKIPKRNIAVKSGSTSRIKKILLKTTDLSVLDIISQLN